MFYVVNPPVALSLEIQKSLSKPLWTVKIFRVEMVNMEDVLRLDPLQTRRMPKASHVPISNSDGGSCVEKSMSSLLHGWSLPIQAFDGSFHCNKANGDTKL